jgi:hypothetical protein
LHILTQPWEKRLRECQWEPATTITIAPDWVSGVYLGKLTAEREGLQSYVIFIVRDDRPQFHFSMFRHDLAGVQPMAQPVLTLR